MGSKVGWGWLWISVCCIVGILVIGCIKGGILGICGNKGVEVGFVVWGRIGVEVIVDWMIKGCILLGWEIELDIFVLGEDDDVERDKVNLVVLLWDVLFSECVLIIIVLVRVGVEVLLLSWKVGCEVMFGNGVVVEIDVNVVILVVLFVVCWDNIGGGLVFGVVVLFIVEVEVVEIGIEGKVFILEIMFLDVGVWIDWDVVDIEIIVGIVMFEIILESIGDLDVGGIGRLFEVIIFV